MERFETTYPVTDVVVQIYSASDKDVRVVECANHEMNIPYDVGIRRWTITAEQFAGVYATDSAIIKFIEKLTFRP